MIHDILEYNQSDDSLEFIPKKLSSLFAGIGVKPLTLSWITPRKIAF
jgi:hypothetical protein